MKKLNRSRWAIALCAVVVTYLSTPAVKAGLLDQFGSALFGRHGAHPEPGDDRGRGGHGADDPTGDDRGRRGHGIQGPGSIDDRRGGPGRGGRDDGPGHR